MKNKFHFSVWRSHYFTVIVVFFQLINTITNAQHHQPQQVQGPDNFQQLKPIKPSIYRGLLNPNLPVQVLEGDQVIYKRIGDVAIRRNSTLTLKYKDVITTPEETIVRYLRNVMGPEFIRAKYKLIPEIYVETNNLGEQRAYHVVYTSLQPLRYNFEKKDFSTKVSFLLVESPPSNDHYAIKAIPIEVTSNSNHSMSPKDLTITHVSIPSSEVKFNCIGPKDSVNIKILTITNPKGYEAYLRVDPALEISTNYSSLEGWGLEQIPLTVQFVGSSSTDSIDVSFSPSRGSMPNAISIRYNETASVSLRSGELGETKITAKSTLGISNEITLKNKFPWMFLFCQHLEV